MTDQANFLRSLIDIVATTAHAREKTFTTTFDGGIYCGRPLLLSDIDYRLPKNTVIEIISDRLKEIEMSPAWKIGNDRAVLEVTP